MEIDAKRTINASQEEVFDAQGGAPNGIDQGPGTCQYIQEDHKLMFTCPGCAKWGGIVIGSPKPVTRPSWDIVSGTPEDVTKLTLSPSINCVGCCGWHGYLKNGVFVSC